MRKTIFPLSLVAFVFLPPFAAAVPKHLADAQQLVQMLDLKNTSYNHGKPKVKWEAPVGVFTDCSGFIDELLTHSYGYTKDDFKKWLGSNRPTAKRYHDKIVDEIGFTHIKKVASIKPGD